MFCLSIASFFLLLLPHSSLLTEAANTEEDLRSTSQWTTLMTKVNKKCRTLLEGPDFRLSEMEFMTTLPKKCLMSLSTNLQPMMQEVVVTKMATEIMLFFQEHRPEKATNKHVVTIVEKYGGTPKSRQNLYDKLNKKYAGKISPELKDLLSPIPIEKNPLETMTGAPEAFVRQFTGLSMECYSQLMASRGSDPVPFSIKCREELIKAQDMISEANDADEDKDEEGIRVGL